MTSQERDLQGMKEHPEAVYEAVAQLREAAAAKKCWNCGCLHNSLAAIEHAFPGKQRPPVLDASMRVARARLRDVQYDCLGCEICYPALAINALQRAAGEHLMDCETCPADDVQVRQGWPPLPGTYRVLRYHAPIAVCTLTDAKLGPAIAQQASSDIAIVGTLHTENLGIERLILNILANPNIRFLIVCGPDSHQAIGHLPGQSLVALSRLGLDNRSRIIDARGKRPILRNIAHEAVEHFRRTIEVVDLIGNAHLPAIIDMVRACAARNPGPAEPFAPERVMAPVAGYLPERMVSDPAGYFVIYVDRLRRLLSLDHYRNDGALDTVIEGVTAAELYIPAIDKGLVTRLDHAAYLGRELARAEHAFVSGDPYIQDAAPIRRSPPISRDSGCHACGGAASS